jgi:hypothetical protein
MEHQITKYKCKHCNKYYASQNSLCNHNKKFHLHNNVVESITKNTYNCRKCNKNFNNYQNRWAHDKICKEDINIKLKQENDELKNKLHELLLQQAKIHPKKLQKINNQLISNININNGTIINNTYVKFGIINHSQILNEKTILNILNKPYQCIEESIKTIHFNKNLPEYNNIYITNMKDDIAYIFDGEKFISVKKNQVIEDLIDNHKEQIEDSFDLHKNKLRDFTCKRLQSFLDAINNEEESYTDKYKKSYQNYKAYKMSDIKLLLYNCCDSKKFDLLKSIELKEKNIDDNN